MKNIEVKREKSTSRPAPPGERSPSLPRQHREGVTGQRGPVLLEFLQQKGPAAPAASWCSPPPSPEGDLLTDLHLGACFPVPLVWSEAVSQLGWRQRGWDGAGGGSPGSFLVPFPKPSSPGVLLPPPQNPKPAGGGCWGWVSHRLPAAPAAPCVPGASSSFSSSSVPWREEINNSRNMNNL